MATATVTTTVTTTINIITKHSCAICMEEDIESLNVDNCCETCCLHTFHIKCVVKWINIKKECPVCRAQIRNKALLFPIKLRTSIELKEDIAISKYRRIKEPIRLRVLNNIKERNEDTVYIDEIEDDNDGIPDELPDLVPYDPSYDPWPWHTLSSNYISYDSAVLYSELQLPAVDVDYWHRLSSNYISDDSAVQYLGLQLQAVDVDYDADDADYHAIPELVPYYNGWNETRNNNIGASQYNRWNGTRIHFIDASASASASVVPNLGGQLVAFNSDYDADYDADYDDTIAIVPQNIQNSGPIIEHDYNPSEMISSASEFTFEVHSPIHLFSRSRSDILMLKQLWRNIIDTLATGHLTITNVENHIYVTIPRQINIGMDAIGYNPLQLPYFTSSENGDINIVNTNTIEEVD
jgi:hypothetical protein